MYTIEQSHAARTSNANLANNKLAVKYSVTNIRAILVSFLVATLIAGGSAPAVAQDKNARAIENAIHLTTLLHAVVPTQLLVMVDKIASGAAARLAPEQPVWILETIEGTILYYQGEQSFVGKPASQLVDDAGQRFGLAAINNAKKSRSRWVTLSLGGQAYKAFCKAQHPTVVCSLAS